VPRRLVPLTHGEGDVRSPTFAPDGNSVVYSSDRGGQWDLWVGLVSGGPPVQITDTAEYEGQPSWSPDGSRVAFTRGRFGRDRPGIFVMPALGGDARRIVENALDPEWSPDGRWIAYAEVSEGWARITKISVAAGGDPVPVTSLEEGFFHRSPGWSPDGRTIVFNRSPGGQTGQLMRVASGGGAADPITQDPEGTANLTARFTPDGRSVVHVSDRGGALNLWRIPLRGGVPERITSGPGQDLTPAVSSDGTKIVFVNSPVSTRILAVSSPESEVKEIALLEGSEAWGPNVSPDGSQIVVSRKVPGRPWEMVLIQRDTQAMRSVLEGLPDVFWGRFHPDGQSLSFHSQHAAGSRIGRVDLDGTGFAWLTPAGEDNGYPSVSASGGQIAFARGGSAGADIVVRRLSADGQERVVVRNATLPSFSPDETMLAFARSRSFAGGVGVVDLEGGEPRWLTTTGTWPTWLPDGSGIAFADVGRQGSQTAWVVSLDDGQRRPLGSFRWGGTHWPFVMAGPDELITTDGSGEKSTLWLAEY